MALVSSLLALTVGSVAAQPSTEPAEPNEECTYFEETSHNLCGVFENFWNTNGGLPVFGYPITESAPEENLDTGEIYETQYFERERMEHHPANAGTPYEVLLGRLGNEVLLAMDRNWFTFPQADPSAEHYMEETGHAIAPEFWDYWSSNGLDLGDDGVSFRESLALFGYPISEAEMETNMAGDTVLTQWFERARFEFHPDNPEDQQVLLGLLGNEILELRQGPGPMPEPPGDVIAEGLNNPRGMTVGADGAVYVTEAGSGGDQCVVATGPEGEEVETCWGFSGAVTRVMDGEQSQVVTELPSVAFGGEAGGPHDVVVSEEGEIHGIIGLGGPPDGRAEFGEVGDSLGYLFESAGDGAWETTVDIAAYEAEANPAGGDLDTNPYSLAMAEDGSYVVSDAGMNALLHVDADGTISTLAVFEPQMVDAPPFLELPEGEQIPMESVPTGVTVGPDGAYYVGELTGFPFEVGSARVWRVTSEGEAEVYAEGFTNIIDVAFDSQGNLHVLELAANSLLNADPSDPASATGALIRVAEDGTQEQIAGEGLIAPTGLTIGPDDTIYVANYGIMPGMGQVVAIEGETPEPPPSAGEVVAEGLNNPRGIDFGDDGSMYVAEAGVGGDDCRELTHPVFGDITACFGSTGAITHVTEDGQEQVVTGLPSWDNEGEVSGPHDVIAAGEDLTFVVGLGGTSAWRDSLEDIPMGFGYLMQSNGEVSPITDLAAYEAENNPDGGIDDSNPYSVAMAPDGHYIVSDAGMNALLHVEADGTTSTLAAFEPRMVAGPGGEEVPMESVPTGVTVGPDGAYYVGELTGFPFEVGSARVWRVTSEGEAEVYAEGFTNIIDVAFDEDGNLYVLEMLDGGLLNANPEDPATAAAQLNMVAPDGTVTEIPSQGLVFATGLAVGPDGAVYVSNFGVMPGMGQVVRIEP